MAADEGRRGNDDMLQLDAELQTALPRIRRRAQRVHVEVRAGTGGDESALFAADLVRMYLPTPSGGLAHRGHVGEPSDLGGYRRCVLRFEGDGVWANEVRVRRPPRPGAVPATEPRAASTPAPAPSP